MMLRTQKLAHALTNLTYDKLSEPARHSARRCLYDAIGCAAAGQSHQAVEMAHRYASSWFRDGAASVWFRNDKLSPPAAAFVNAYATSILDIDDGHRAAAGHPGAAVIPAVLAAAECCETNLSEVLLAIVCGYEAGIGIAKARDPSRLSSVATGRWSAVAVAAGVAKLRGFTAEKMAHAIAISESQAPNLLAADHSGFLGGDTKEGIPWSVLTGMAAADQAALGFRGYLAALDNPEVYRPGGIATDLDKECLIETTYFKEYSCCRWIHSAIEAVSEMRKAGLNSVLVEEIEISTFQRALGLNNPTSPDDLIAAQFSVPFAVAVALVDGDEALKPMSVEILGRQDIIRVAQMITMRLDKEFDSCFPAQIPARVRVKVAGKHFEKEVWAPLGDPTNPLSDSQLIEKSMKLCSHLRSERQISGLAEHIFQQGSAQGVGISDPLAAMLNFLR
jgi:2-methylcitrate dehydratase PrpD